MDVLSIILGLIAVLFIIKYFKPTLWEKITTKVSAAITFLKSLKKD